MDWFTFKSMSWDSGLGGLPEPTPDRMRGSEIDRLRNMTQAGEDAVELDRLTPKGTRTSMSSVHHIS